MHAVPFRVVDSQTEADITRAILLQIIMEQEAGGNPLFTANMLERLREDERRWHPPGIRANGIWPFG